MVTDEEMAKKYVEVNEQAHQLYEKFLPGPVTVVSKSLGGTIAQGVASEFGTLGIRIPDYNLMLAITQEFGNPITATSANASGKKRPYSVGDIIDGLNDKQKNLIDLVLDAGQLPKNEPSTVIDTTLSAPVTLRNSGRSEHRLETQTLANMTTVISKSEQETQEIAGRLILKHWDDVVERGLVFCLDGDLGMGKTIFTKGSAQFLGIEEIIKSPTYTYIEEYDYIRHQTEGKFFHLDMWKVEDREMFKRLEVEKLFGPKNVVVVEWFSQVAEFMSPLLSSTAVIKVKFSQVGEDRKLEIIE
jgi:tRNA threonylcarbamoyl adenosine modification protein (Sua5/YciO/YrdC/YwlC family)/tRNA threonylcarbamoyl adenosine modification protein YjeE